MPNPPEKIRSAKLCLMEQHAICSTSRWPQIIPSRSTVARFRLAHNQAPTLACSVVSLLLGIRGSLLIQHEHSTLCTPVLILRLSVVKQLSSFSSLFCQTRCIEVMASAYMNRVYIKCNVIRHSESTDLHRQIQHAIHV